jgi:hypothetical protein
MKYIKQVTCTPHEAKSLVHDGFILKLVGMRLDGLDTYAVYAVQVGQ